MQNREIEFRAYDHSCGEMITDFSTRSSDKYLIDFSNGKLEIGYFEKDGDYQGLIPLQYTGFKTNGVKVYEGDIIENDSEWWQVIWDQDGGQWYLFPLKGGNVHIALSEIVPSQETWVMGNIYQNSNLLK